jgi:aspartate carbamoyltransferase catalytic subunit
MLLDTASEMHEVQRREVKKLPTLRGRTIINLFFEDSTRTRSSFEIAGKWMSADTINITGKGSAPARVSPARHRAHHRRDGRRRHRHAPHAPAEPPTRSRSGSTPASSTPATAPTSTRPRPCSTPTRCEQRLGDLDGAHVAIVGDLTHSRVFRSNVDHAADPRAPGSPSSPPDADAERHPPVGCRRRPHPLRRPRRRARERADAVMMLRVQRERMSGGFFPTPREYTVGVGLTRDRLRALADANSDAVICHPGPMNRGLEISADAADAARSLVLDQVSAGVAVRMSVLYHLLAGEGVAA